MAGNRTNRVQYHCSFCGKNQDQVRRLIAGPGAVYICDERTGRHNGNKAARDLNNAHDLSNRHVRASSTHAHDKGVVHDPNSARSAHDHSRVQHRNEPPHVRDRSGSKSRLVCRCTSRIGVELG